MQASSWLKSQELFEHAVLMDSSQREEFLQRECVQDLVLFEDVLRLLDAHDNAPKILQKVRYKHFTLTQKGMSHQLVGPYQIVKKLGSGGMGIVYKAFDIRLERYLALKFLPQNLTTDERAKKRLLREAKAASALSHQHLCTVYDIEETDDGQIYIAMAYYEGKNFDSLIENGSLTLSQAITAARQIASGLIAAHAKSIIHRDIKPANLILNGNRGIKILDFGIAKFTNIQGTDTAVQGGTVAYMSPEHIRGEKLDVRTDIWSTAVILYEMVSGRKPFAGNSLPETMHRVLNDPTPRLSQFARGIPKPLDDLIYKALSKDINNRYQTMSELLQDLDTIADQLGISLRSNKKSTKLAAKPDSETDRGDTSRELSNHTNMTQLNNMPPEDMPFANNIEVVCAAISLANYDDLNSNLDSAVFQQLVGVYLRGIKKKVTRNNGLIKTLVGNTIVCEFKYAPEFLPSSLRAINAANEIHAHIRSIAQANNVELNCFVTMTEISCSEINILDCAKQLSTVAAPMDTFASDAVYHSIKSTYHGVPVDAAIADAFLAPGKVWRICDDVSSLSNETSDHVGATGYTSAATVSEQEAGSDLDHQSIPEHNTAKNNLVNSEIETVISEYSDPSMLPQVESPDVIDAQDAQQKFAPLSDKTEADSPADPAFGVQSVTSALNSNDSSHDPDITPVGAHRVESKYNPASYNIPETDTIIHKNVPSFDSTADSASLDSTKSSGLASANSSSYQGTYVASKSYVGRTNLLTEIESILANCIAKQQAHMIQLSGANGIGKTRLASEVQLMAQQLGFECHQQINVEFGADEGLQLFSKISKSILSKISGEAINAELSLLDYAESKNIVSRDLLVYLYDILGLTPEKTLDAKPAASIYSTWIKQRNKVLQCIFSSVSESNPLFIFIDDLQWSDKITIQSLVEIIAGCTDKPIVIITTSNRNSLNMEPILEENLNNNHYSVFELVALNQPQAEQLANQIIELPRDILDTLLQTANGMPLKVKLMAQYSAACGKTDFPSTVAELVMLYLSTLPDEDIRALWAASTIGGIFSQSCIRYLINNQEYDCQRLIDCDLIEVYGQYYVFTHPLIFRAIYETMEDDTKRELHNQAAEWYSYVDYSVRAEHLDRAENSEAISAYLQAATQLDNIFHLQPAQKYAKRGLELATKNGDESSISQLTTLLNNIDQRRIQ